MIASAVRWSRRNLFAKPFDVALSVIAIPLGLWLLASGVTWALGIARWDILAASIKVLMVGLYPDQELWRVWAALFGLSLMLGVALGSAFQFRIQLQWAILLTAATVGLAATQGTHANGLPPMICTLCVLGGWYVASRWAVLRRFLPWGWSLVLLAVFAVLAPVGMQRWGGLLLTVLVTVVTAMTTLPLGIMLAFGRRSRIASIRVLCTAYIEIMRSVPLILIVYCVWIVLPILVPQYSGSDLLRGMAGFIIFFSAYVAEYVRSGLQAVPKGQVEAARSVGLSEMDVNRFILLPQAIRVVVPALVGNILDIFNAVPLLFIIGLTDFLRAGQLILANPQFSDRTYEIYAFLFATYFVIGSSITFAARRLELHLSRSAA